MEFCLRVFVIICTFASCLANPVESSSVDFISDYITNGDLETFLVEMQKNYPEKSKLHSIGKSVNDNDLWVMEISGDIKNTDDKPKFRYVGNVRGNEVLGRYLLVRLVQYLLGNYEIDDDVTKIIDSTDIFIMPSMNPDGFADAIEGECMSEAGKTNANEIDLMRNFPDPNKERGEEWFQPETLAMMDWMNETNFVLSASLNMGDIGAAYREASTSGNTQDVKMFEHLVDAFSSQHPRMGDSSCEVYDPLSRITNGEKWHESTGQMEDYVYRNHKSLEIAFYLACCNYPPKEKLNQHWRENRLPLLNYMEQVHKGIQGQVLDENDRPLPGALIDVEYNGRTTTTDQNGYFWRLLFTGSHELSIRAHRYKRVVRRIEVGETAVRITIKLESDNDTP